MGNEVKLHPLFFFQNPKRQVLFKGFVPMHVYDYLLITLNPDGIEFKRGYQKHQQPCHSALVFPRKS